MWLISLSEGSEKKCGIGENKGVGLKTCEKFLERTGFWRVLLQAYAYLNENIYATNSIGGGREGGQPERWRGYRICSHFD